AHAAAMLGAKTAVFTMSLDAIGNMPCNPSIGGTAKGTLVRELDALGGVMGLAADATYLQSRMLNKGKGPAVHALRVQTDRKRYHEYMKHALELTPGLAIHQAEIISIEVEDGHVKGVVTQLNGEYGAKCVVIATGTNLGGKIFVVAQGTGPSVTLPLKEIAVKFLIQCRVTARYNHTGCRKQCDPSTFRIQENRFSRRGIHVIETGKIASRRHPNG
ncbi:tRNA uridine 5-carboxymethylaminomethyl modification enzyme GidA, partial [human gut metagenome]